MRKLSDYQFHEQIGMSYSWLLYKAVSILNQEQVLIKTSRNQASPHAKAELIHEYYLLKELDLTGVLKPVALKKGKEIPYLVMEFFDGIPLSDWMKGNPAFDVNRYLKMALQLTSILSAVHQHHIIHKSLHLDNILYDNDTNQLKLTGFHQSTTLSKETPQADITPYQIGEVISVSPEQTGRMNRAIDYRTDLYSLGVLFYQLATGRAPFEGKGQAEIIHAHLAQTAVSPDQINPALPTIVSSIIMKLLAKDPENRYQSTYGLKKDLEKCFALFHSEQEVDVFPLAEHDVSPMLEKPNKLYGRGSELALLMESFERVQHGRPGLVLIPGSAGIGKTALVQHLHTPLLHKKGYFISGKFVQFQKHTPYAPIIEAFRSLIKQILTEDNESIQRWKEKLTASLAINAWVVANFIPEIEWVIGKQEDGPDIPSQGMHNRFLLAIRRFVDVFAVENHPLVLFIDDLQWADNATIDLMRHLLTNQARRDLLIIAAYRDNEVSIGHPFELFLKQIKNQEIDVVSIPIRPLTQEHIEQWVEDILDLKGGSAHPLVTLIFRITKGNPFFIIQLLQLLHQEKWISFDLSTATWQVNLTALQQIPMTDSMIDFIKKQINKLPVETFKLLQLAACIGSQFNLKLLATIAGESYEKTANLLWEGLEEGVILPMDASYKWVYPNENQTLLNENPPSYRFLHDKIQQAFYSSMDETQRVQSHRTVAEEFIQHFTEEEVEEHLFSIVQHLNVAQSLLTTSEQQGLIKWNRKAGDKAKRAAAFEAALTFYQHSFHLFQADKWQADYDETSKVMLGYGETLYLNRNFDEAEAIFEEVLVHARTNQEKLSIYNLKIQLYTYIHEVKQATNAGLTGVGLFGLTIKDHPGKALVAKEYLLTKLALGKKNGEDLLNLPAVTDDNQRLIMRTLINTNAPTYHVDQNLATILMLRALRLTIKYGDMDLSALVYNNYALTLSAGFGDYNGSYQFGKLAIQHVGDSGDTALEARVYFVFGSFVNHWKQPIRYNLDYLERSQQLSVETGNLHLAGATGAFIGLTHLLKGDNLSEVKEGIERQITLAQVNEFVISSDFLQEILDWIAVLSEPDRQPNWEFPDLTDDMSVAIMHKTLRLQMSFLLNNQSEAVTLMEELEPIVDKMMVLIIAPEYFFYQSLWLTKLLTKCEIPKKTAYKKLRRNVKKLKKWATHAPVNYLHKYLLICAELEKLANNEVKAGRYYHQALQHAEENEFLQDMAIANHCAASFYLSINLPKTAKSYVTEAYNSYIAWGAVHIAQQMKDSFPNLLLQTNKSYPTDGNVMESLDNKAILEAARIISGEVVLDKLVSKLMDIFITYAGAEHASFLIQEQQNLALVSFKHIEGKIEMYQQLKTVDESSHLSSAIIHYVVNSREAVVLNNATEEGPFIEDDYLQEVQAKSVLCLPIVHQDRLVAILYMENNKSSHVFTRERLNVLTLIASQASVSLVNAYLYAELEAKVKQRTDLLNDANQELTAVNQQLTNSKEKMKQMISNISHDLQSPVAVVQGYIGALLDGLVDDPVKQNEFLHTINYRMGSLSKLIKDLFDLSKLESGDMKFSMEAIPVDQLFDHFCQLFKLEIIQSGLQFKRRFNRDQAQEYPLLEVDVQRLEQVMANLISNAIKYADKGTIEIGLTITGSNGAVFSIRDEGAGITAQDLPYVFDRYYTNSKRQGSGLGLAISKEIITMHNGNIWVDSQIDQGTTFNFSIPLVSHSLETRGRFACFTRR